MKQLPSPNYVNASFHSREKCEITRNQSNKIAEILVYRHIKTNL